MNFQTIPPVPKVKELLDLAFGKARTKVFKKVKGERIQILKTKETRKLDVIKHDLCQRLDKVTKSFPAIDHLPSFYLKLLHLTLDYVQLKKSLGAMSWAKAKISVLHKMHIRKIVQEGSIAKINPIAKQFYGRVSSIIRQIQPNLTFLEASRRSMKQYPDIKEMVTVCIYGFPNVGKSTLLNMLTGSRAKVEAYAFTTKGINAGYLYADSLALFKGETTEEMRVKISQETEKGMKKEISEGTNDKEIANDQEAPPDDGDSEGNEEAEAAVDNEVEEDIAQDKSRSKHSARPKIQLLDVPGTLARAEKMNNIERIAELVVEELAHLVIYVFDITEYCGYSLEQQLELFRRFEKNRNIAVYISKSDLQDQAVIDAWAAEHRIKHYSFSELQQKIAGLGVLQE